MQFKFSKYFALITISLFLFEVAIATIWKHIDWLRAYGGDVIVVILIYAAIRTFFRIPKMKLIIGIVAFAFIIEALQYFKFASLLGVSQGSVLEIVLGNHFSWIDMACYLLGGIILWLIPIDEKLKA